MLVGPPPPPQPTVVVVERVEDHHHETQSARSDSGRIRKPPSGGAIATGMLDDESEGKPEQTGMFVTHRVEPGQSSAARAWVEEQANSSPKFRTAAAALAQIEAAQKLLEQTTETDVRVSLAKRLHETYLAYFELRERETQGLAT